MRNEKGQYLKGFHLPTQFKVGNSGYWLGKKRDKLTIEKMRLGRLGKKDSPETIEKKRLAGLGRKATEETKKKLSELKKGKPAWNKGRKLKPMSEQGRKNISMAQMGRIPWNKGKIGVMPTPWNKGTKGIMKPNKGSFIKGNIPIHVFKKGQISFMKGKHHSEESKRKMSEHNNKIWLGKKRPNLHSEESKRKISIYHKGKKHSEEWKRNMSIGMKGIPRSEETKQKFRDRMLGTHLSIETKKKLSEYNILHPNRVYKNTSIEIKIETELKRLGINYQKQIPLCKIAVVDFLLKEINTVIQADGCYWHGCPEHFPSNTRRQEADKNQDTILGLNGYKVVRFWEHEINKSVEECIDKVLF